MQKISNDRFQCPEYGLSEKFLSEMKIISVRGENHYFAQQKLLARGTFWPFAAMLSTLDTCQRYLVIDFGVLNNIGLNNFYVKSIMWPPEGFFLCKNGNRDILFTFWPIKSVRGKTTLWI